jgi:hypothetical protein
MTEADWLKCTDPKPMLQFLNAHRASHRKLRLFASLCCERVWERHKPDFVHAAILESNRAADGVIGDEELREVEQSIGVMGSYSAAARAGDVARTCVYQNPGEAAEGASVCALSYFALTAMESIGEEVLRRQAFAIAEQLERVLQAALLRELFGNPFRPVALNPAWLTVEVIELAQQAAAEPKSHRFVLAEALTKAGCDDLDILSHCNQFGGHRKGCWVIDLILGKE